jgi:pimeloyl-ACP methyl ester carboxylesterase
MGLGAFKWAWQRQTKDFGHDQADKYTCLVFDNRGIGESDKPLLRYSTSEMAKDTIELIDHLEWTKERQLHIIASSLGGMIAQELVTSLALMFREPVELYFSDSIFRPFLFPNE